MTLRRILLALIMVLVAAPGAAQAQTVSGSGASRSTTGALQLARVPPALSLRPANLEAAIESSREEARDREGGRISGPGKGEGERPRPAADPGLGATATFPPRSPSARVLGPRAAATVASSFGGPDLNDSGAFPPDSMADVGPTQVFVTINGRFRTYDKSTGLFDNGIDIDPDTFFSLPITDFSSDPRIRFDRRAQRWVLVMIDVVGGTASAENHVHIAVSDGPTLSSSTVWTFHQFAAGTGLFLDYPTLGVDRDALYIGGLDFSTVTGNFTASRAYVVNKASAYGSGTLTVTPFTTGADTGAGVFLPQGVDARDDSGNGHGYFIGIDNATLSTIDVLRVDDPAGTPALSSPSPITVPSTAPPILVPHPGNTSGAGRLDAIDDRLMNASLRAGHIYAAHSIRATAAGAGSGSGDRDASRWYDVDVSGASPALAQSGTVFDTAASAPRFFFMPSIGVNGAGTVVVGGTVAGATAAPNAWVASRSIGDATGALTSAAAYTSSTAAYNPPGDDGGGFARRWGDYSYVTVDPLDDQTLWTIQEYAESTNVWGVRIARIRDRSPATPGGATVAPGLASATVVVDGAGGAWFEPGAAFPQHLRVTAGCGIAVTSATVQSPTRLVLDLDTRAASPGSGCDLTVTNPDGQTATGARALTVSGETASPPGGTTTTPAGGGDVPATPQQPAETTPTAMTPKPAPVVQAAKPRCVVPSLKNHTLTGARKMLTRAHCRLGTVRNVAVRRSRVRHRRVLTSSPAARTRLGNGAHVALRLRR